MKIWSNLVKSEKVVKNHDESVSAAAPIELLLKRVEELEARFAEDAGTLRTPKKAKKRQFWPKITYSEP